MMDDLADLLAQAEQYHVLGDRLMAMEVYEQAIALAHAPEPTHADGAGENGGQAVIRVYELAAQFYLDWGKPKIARCYLTEAHQTAMAHGAWAQADALKERYPSLLAREPVSGFSGGDRLSPATALHGHPSLFQAIFEQVAVGIHLADPTGRFIQVNHQFCDLLGYRAEELLQRTVQSVTHPDDLAQQRPLMQQLLAGDIPSFTMEKRYIRRDGSMLWTKVALSSIRDGAGRPISDLAVVEDISDAKQLEAQRQQTLEQLRQSQECWQLLLQSSGDDIWDWNVRTNQVSRSPQWKRLLGYDENEVENTHAAWISLLHPNDRDRVLAAQQAYLHRTTPTYIEDYRLRCRNGTYKWMHSRGQAVWDEQGNPLRMVGFNTDIDQRKQAEAALRNSEQRLRLITNGLPGCISYADAAQRYQFVNQTYELWFGLQAVEMVGKTIVEVIGDAAYQRTRPYIEQALAGESVTYETEVPYQYGGTRFISATLVPDQDEEGRVNGYYALVLDISDRHQAEQALRDSQCFLDSVINAINDPIFVKDDQHRWVLANAAFDELLGVPRQVSIGQSDYDIFPAEQADVFWEKDNEVLTTGKDNLNEEWITHAQQGLRLIATKKSRFQDSLGRNLLVGYTRDITDQKQMEQSLHQLNNELEHRVQQRTEELEQQTQLLQILLDSSKQAEAQIRENEERLRLALEAASQGLYDLDLQTGEAIVSPTYATMLGYEPAEFRETNAQWIERLHPDDRERVAAVYRAYITGQTPAYKVEFRQRTKDGGWKWVLSLGKIVAWDDQGQPLRMLGIHTDISDRKQAEEVLRQANAELEFRVEERTAELRQAKDAAEAASRAKSAFLANMSHELRTPLNAILGFSQLMVRDASLPDPLRENLAIINRSGEHLLNLINDILEMSKIEAGQISVYPGDFDLYSLLGALIDMFRMRAETKGLQLALICAPDVPQAICTDENKLRQVLINLLSNAVKFTASGLVILRVQREPATASSDALTLRFEVEDTGPGIPASDLDVLFDPFVQSELGYRSQEGTGLGLSICRQYVRLLGGEITLDSVVGQGTLAWFTIQATVAQSSSWRSPQPQRQVIGLVPGQPTYRMLIVEDNPANRKLLVALLQPLGFDLQEATNGREAIALWESQRPHLIWMDMRMPEMDGYEATDQIRQQDRATKIVALTASAFEEQRAKISTLGCDAFIRKPYQIEQVFDTIAQLLGVQYCYAPVEQDNLLAPQIPPTLEFSSATTPTLTVEALQVMPEEWVYALQQAAMELDGERLTRLIRQIPPGHAALAKALQAKVREFEFETILELSQGVLADGEAPLGG